MILSALAAIKLGAAKAALGAAAAVSGLFGAIMAQDVATDPGTLADIVTEGGSAAVLMSAAAGSIWALITGKIMPSGEIFKRLDKAEESARDAKAAAEANGAKLDQAIAALNALDRRPTK